MRENTFAFGTDFHGNLENIDLFLRESEARQTHHVIFGGDIAPKKMAIGFQDKKGVRFENVLKNEIAIDPECRIEDEAELYGRGYMIFAEELNSQEFQSLLRLFYKLKHLATTKEKNKLQLEEAEWELIKNRIIPELLDYLKSNQDSKFFFQKYQDRLGKSQTPEEFCEEFLKFLQYTDCTNTAYKNNGKFEFLKSEARMSLYEIIWRMEEKNFYLVISNFFHAWSPFKKWDEIYKKFHQHAIEGQKKFMRDLIKRLRALKKRCPETTITAILGNDDDGELSPMLQNAERQGLLYFPNNRIVSLSPDTQIIGYPYVPPLPEVEHDFWFKDEKDIGRDLKKFGEESKLNMLKRKTGTAVNFCIANIHCPPAGTNLAKAYYDAKAISPEDFGSIGVRKAIEEIQPTLGLFGHIHEAWRITGQVRDQIGSTVVLNPGASEFNPRFVFGSLENPGDFELVAGE